MENKYYTPEIEEICIGFEFEFYDEDDRDWTNTIIKSQSELCNWTGLDIKIRVKYLDKEDIEECGWEYDELSKFHRIKIGTASEDWQLHLERDNNTIIIARNRGQWIKFHGTIKNKSELKRLMKWLNINSQ